MEPQVMEFLAPINEITEGTMMVETALTMKMMDSKT